MDPAIFPTTPAEETSNLHKETEAQTVLFQGEKALLNGDYLLGTALFEKASTLFPSADFFFRQALALFEYGSEKGRETALLLASKKLKMASKADPERFTLWHLWGNTLSLLGIRTEEHHYFLEAEEKYRKAFLLSSKEPLDIRSDFYWDYAVVWHHLGKHSGEAADMQRAADFFHQASSLQEHLPAEFWYDFGESCQILAQKINDVRLFVKAIHCFKHAISQNSSFFEGWFSLATALEDLYSYTHDEDHFTQANECYATASLLHPNDSELWLSWADFLCTSGKRHRDVKRLKLCIEKCQKALALSPEDSYGIALWAEAQATMGEISEQVELIVEAHNKISALANTLESPEVLHSCGVCLSAFGHYYIEVDDFYQAIEKFQAALSIDRTCHRSWHALASSYASIGIVNADPESLEKSFRFFSKALDLHPSSFYLFDYALAVLKLGEMTHLQKWLEKSLEIFEQALSLQKNAVYLHPDWLYFYASALDQVGDFYEEAAYYEKAIEILAHVLMVDPDFPGAHHRLALAYSHLGDLLGDSEILLRAVHHFRLALKQEDDNDYVLLDMGVTLINLVEYLQDPIQKALFKKEAENKLLQAAKLGNVHAYYPLGCFFALSNDNARALFFLEKADAFHALPPLEEIYEDEWLDSLQETPAFREFLSSLEKKHV